MKSTKIGKIIQRNLDKVLEVYQPIVKIIQAIDRAGGRALLVGGAVRDLLLKLPIKDLDIEVHQLSIEQLETLLSQFGPVSVVGKSFGVLRLHGLDVDWSLPRSDLPGRKPKVHIDPAMSIKEAFRRRDLTINALGIDLKTYELLDPFNGLEDLKQKILRATDKEKFVEDPLRFYRVMQFIGRFQMNPDDQLNEICKSMDLSGVSIERIETEFDKLMLKSKKPSLGFRWLKDIGRLREILPELADIVDIQQDPGWHPEGEVFEHTMQALDAAATFKYEDDQEKLIVMYAVLCHDLGKATTTEHIGGVWKSISHGKEGVVPAKNLLGRITKRKDIVDAIKKLVRYHMMPPQFVAAEASAAAYKRLAKKLAPHTTITVLGKVSLADKQGRSPILGEPLKKSFFVIEKFLDVAKKIKVETLPEPPVLLGRDLIDVVEPGPKMGKLLKKAYDIQIKKGITDKEELKKIILQDKK